MQLTLQMFSVESAGENTGQPSVVAEENGEGQFGNLFDILLDNVDGDGPNLPETLISGRNFQSASRVDAQSNVRFDLTAAKTELKRTQPVEGLLSDNSESIAEPEAPGDESISLRNVQVPTDAHRLVEPIGLASQPRKIAVSEHRHDVDAKSVEAAKTDRGIDPESVASRTVIVPEQNAKAPENAVPSLAFGGNSKPLDVESKGVARLVSGKVTAEMATDSGHSVKPERAKFDQDGPDATPPVVPRTVASKMPEGPRHVAPVPDGPPSPLGNDGSLPRDLSGVKSNQRMTAVEPDVTSQPSDAMSKRIKPEDQPALIRNADPKTVARSVARVDVAHQPASATVEAAVNFDVNRQGNDERAHDLRETLPDIARSFTGSEKHHQSTAGISPNTAATVGVPTQIAAVQTDLFAAQDPGHQDFDIAELSAGSERIEAKRISPDPGLRLADPAARPVIAQIVQATKSSTEGIVEVRLSPEELGRVRLSMTAGETGMVVHVAAERPETLELLRRNVDVFAANLQQEGFGNLNFSFGGEQAPDHADAEFTIDDGTLGEAPAIVGEKVAQVTSLTIDGKLDIRL